MSEALARGREPSTSFGGEGPWLRRPRQRTSSVTARGEPMLWLTGSALVICLLMICGLLAWIGWQGFGTFWPTEVQRIELHDGRALMGEVARRESYRPDPTLLAGFEGVVAERAQAELAASDGQAQRSLLRTGNFELSSTHYHWVNDFEVALRETPEWAVVIERLEWGRFYGCPTAYVHLTPVLAREPDAARAEAAELAASMQQQFGASAAAVLVEREVAGVRRELLVTADEIQPQDAVAGVAQVDNGAAAAWAKFAAMHGSVRDLWRRKKHLEKAEMGAVHDSLEDARLRLRSAELELHPPPLWIAAYRALAQARADGDSGTVERLQQRLREVEAQSAKPDPAFLAVVDEVEQAEQRAHQAFGEVAEAIRELDREMERHALLMTTASGEQKLLRLYEIVRAYAANQLDFFGQLGVYASRWWEFVADEPRESNFEGGVLPAIFGTVLMTLIMCVFVVPFGVLAALYVREYAKAGPLISIVRIAVNNLAGVPSIVFGVFGLGFFCYIAGSGIDELFYPERLPQPTFGTGGVLWASLTLALLTLPVVIVATEEAVAAVPGSMREGSYACGASKWQTIRRIVLPRAMPGIMTGAILAMARGAGEVAPLMLVGAVKLAPKLPLLDGGELLGLNNSFMHLGFHIYDLGFQSQNSEAAKPMVFTTTLLLIAIIAILNLTAVWLRTRLHRKYVSSHF